jgi:hypothetical protein
MFIWGLTSVAMRGFVSVEGACAMREVVDYILANLATLGTLLGVCISVGLLLETRKQRQQSYQPQLFIRDQQFWLEKNPNGTPCFMKSTSEHRAQLYGPQFVLKLENVGVGTAHSIGVYWRYPARRYTREVIDLGKSTKRLVNDYQNHFQYLFNEGADTGYGFLLDDPSDEKRSVSFMKSGETLDIRLPETIKNYLTFMPYLQLMKDSFPHSIDLKLTDIGIDFIFSDISGRQRRQRISIYIEIYAMGQEQYDSNYAFGTLFFGAPRRIRRIATEKKKDAALEADRLRSAKPVLDTKTDPGE